jgi:hypothetical protein
LRRKNPVGAPGIGGAGGLRSKPHGPRAQRAAEPPQSPVFLQSKKRRPKKYRYIFAGQSFLSVVYWG